MCMHTTAIAHECRVVRPTVRATLIVTGHPRRVRVPRGAVLVCILQARESAPVRGVPRGIGVPGGAVAVCVLEAREVAVGRGH